MIVRRSERLPKRSVFIVSSSRLVTSQDAEHICHRNTDTVRPPWQVERVQATVTLQAGRAAARVTGRDVGRDHVLPLPPEAIPTLVELER